MFEKIAKNLSIYSLCIFFLGYAYKQSYYSVFNIDITNYISNSEIFYTLLPILLIVFSIGQSLFNYGIKQQSLTKDSQENLTTNSIVPKKQNRFFNKFISWDLLWFLLMLFGLLYPLIFKNIEALMEYQPYITILFWVSIFTLLQRKALLRIHEGTNVFFILVLFMYTGFIFIQFGKSKANSLVTFGNKQILYTFRFKDNTISTNKNFIFVGETQSTLFFYNRKDSTTSILKRSEIDSFTIKRISGIPSLF